MNIVADIIAEASASSVPTYKADTVYHVGDLSRSRTFHKATGNEGDGVPVSEHPKSLSKIARLNGSSLWLLRKKGGTFLDALALMRRKSDVEKVFAWAQEAGYVTPSKLWKISYNDEEMSDEEKVYILFDNESEARAEYEQHAEYDEEVEIEEIPGRKPTKKMIAWWKSVVPGSDHIPHTIVDDMIIFLYAKEQTDLDGVWWKEHYDPDGYSAPRGSIFQQKMSSWKMDEVEWSETPEEGD